MSERLDLYQYIRVHSASRIETTLRVLITDRYGTPRLINWAFDDIATAKRQLRTVKRWRRRRTPLTYVMGNGESALVDDEQLFKSASAGVADVRRPIRSTSSLG